MSWKIQNRGLGRRVGSEGCWENLEARFGLVCKYIPQLIVLDLKPNNNVTSVNVSRAECSVFDNKLVGLFPRKSISSALSIS